MLVSAGGKITGYTIGNDMSSRDIEGENPLYLPQAKVLAHEIYGPSAILLRGKNEDDLIRVAKSLPGSLTATTHGTEDDLEQYRRLVSVLETKAGRLIFNGYPTGVEVSPAMHHGGPYPATADPKFTSVGTAAILRFLRPVCYQNFPNSALPPELQDDNPRQIWRTLSGSLSRASGIH